jgi:hypothetical protein|tara:strand:+ start:458 stop:931 length:474 start_codon:yes stop_codon:yes gene_type:complete
MELFTSKALIVSAIASIQTSGAKLDNDIWIAAVSAMSHHAKHGNPHLINDLVSAMPKGSRVNALRDYILAHGKVKFNEKEKVFTHDKEGSFDLDGAIAISWVEFKPEPEYKPIDVLKLVKALAKKVSEAKEENGDKCSDEQALAVMALATKLGVELD